MRAVVAPAATAIRCDGRGAVAFGKDVGKLFASKPLSRTCTRAVHTYCGDREDSKDSAASKKRDV